MEYLDVLDLDGNPTGQSKLRSEVHRDGDWHRLVFVWILNSKEELLIQKRAASTEVYPEKWDVSAAGHVPSGKTSLLTAVEEISEELGIMVDGKKLRYLFTVKEPWQKENGLPVENQWSDVFLLQEDLELANLELRKEELDAVRFVSIDELEKLINKRDGSFTPRYQQYEMLFKTLRG